MSQLEALQTVAALRLLADDVKNGVDEFSTLRVVTFRPVVAGAALSEDEVVWPEDLSEGTRPDRVHRARLQVNEDGARHIPAA